MIGIEWFLMAAQTRHAQDMNHIRVHLTTDFFGLCVCAIFYFFSQAPDKGTNNRWNLLYVTRFVLYQKYTPTRIRVFSTTLQYYALDLTKVDLDSPWVNHGQPAIW